MEQICFSKKQLTQLESQIAELLHRTNSVISTIPGVGDTLGAVILSEIGDIQRFDSPSKLVAFAGLDVKVNQSGEFTGTKTTFQAGIPYLRRAIWLAASRAAFCGPCSVGILPIAEEQGQTSSDCCWRRSPQDVQHPLRHSPGKPPLQADAA